MAMTIELPALERTDADTPASPAPGRLRRFARPALGLLLPVGLALGWEIVVWFGLSSGRLVPPPSKLFATIMELAESGELTQHVVATLTRVGAGFGIGVVAGTLLGAVAGYWDLARRLLDPSVQALRAIPSLAWVPLFVLWMGIGEQPKITLIAVGVFFPVYTNLVSGIRQVDRKLLEAASAYGYRRISLAGEVVLPAALPSLFTGLRLGLAQGWLFLVAAELIGASQGLGFLLVDGQNSGRADIIVLSIIFLAIIGKLTDTLLQVVEHRLLRWTDTVKR